MNSEPRSILLADDDDNDAMLLRMVFGKVRLVQRLQRVKDGVEAIQYLGGDGIYADRKRYPFPSLLLLDLKMPRRNGFEVLEWLRMNPPLRGLIVTVLTASKDDADIRRAYSLCANSYLVKPATLEQLEKMSKTIKEYWIEMNEHVPCGLAEAQTS